MSRPAGRRLFGQQSNFFVHLVQGAAGDALSLLRPFAVAFHQVVLVVHQVVIAFPDRPQVLGHGFAHELMYLTVHSVLHLLGYDHVDEGEMKRRMRGREKAIMERLGEP